MEAQSEQLPPALQEAIAAFIKNEGYLTHDLKSKQISTNGGNYAGFLYEIDIKGKTEEGDKENSLFVKYVISLNENLNSVISYSDVYLLEKCMYTEISEIFTKLEEKAGVPLEERYKIVKGYSESTSEVIILDNAAKKGFKCCERLDVVPLKFMELSLQQLAKFHGLGFVIEKLMPEYFERKIKTLTFPVIFNEHYLKFAATIAETAIKCLKGDTKEKARKLAPQCPKKMEQYLFDKPCVSTLCHGDFRANNILMREEKGEIAEVIPVDYQTVYYGNPANDLLYFIYTCTDREYRKQNMQYLIDLYYETMKKFLNYFDLDVAAMYPRAKLDEDIKNRTYVPVCLALNYFPVMFASEDNIPDMGAESPMENVQLEPKIVRRIEEIFEDFNFEI